MTVRLASVSISNFRSCKSTSAILRPFTALVGYNNAGKSNIILAIKWLLDGSLISESDVYDPTHPVSVEGVIQGITDDTLSLLTEENQQKIAPFIIDGTLTFARRQEFNKETGKAKKSLDVYDGTTWKKNPGGIDGAISNIFPEPIHIPAMSDAVEDSTKCKNTTTIGKILSAIVSEIKQEHEEKFSKNISEIGKYLSHNGENRLESLNKIDSGVNKKVNQFFPDVSVKLHFPTPTLDEIFKSGTLKVFESREDEPVMRDISRFGHGTQRSIQMALIQYLAEIKKENSESKKSNTLIFIDEPELYLHPSAINSVRESLVTLSESGYQVIISTHSASMLSAKHAANAIQVCKDSNGTIARKTISEKIEELYKSSSPQLHSAFTLSNSSYLLFSEEVLLVEGKTETNVLYALYKKINGRELNPSKICIVAVDGKGSLFKMSQIINAIGIKTRILADCDFLSNILLTEHKDLLSTECDNLLTALIESINSGELSLNTKVTTFESFKSISSKDFIKICNHEKTQKHIHEIHQKLKDNGIYIWKSGDIEAVYGFGKKQTEWDSLLDCLCDESKDVRAVIKKYDEMEDFIKWI
ncbi:ATP-dependent nuclease [Escherichia coli]|uniref:ATP-dependent endonuclease of the OLD family-like protein n=1 Tax=Escherichia coli TaxID=562 RepID=A0A376P8Q0_ECOLX|nr:AAA family ATPase [Escherichia coli]EFL6573678.1 AAA family ATPase [Escherichia coli]MEB7141770.1 AAA family ATPase [Escherichia coli]STG99946.1 ATP-dependent endonuclease of the OLD family-like protein [Escherichia coli]STH74769.1 ATP-dependent endonuclease of the OLD family-like protein [Escherichia coli]STJ03176.1 ATP-dependent endonuclease of the OLD family-like protein [Escherichia coli]